MTSRRTFLAGMLAAGALPTPTWAEAGDPAFLSAARAPDGAYRLCGLDARGQVLFQQPLPARGHAAAAHPTRPEAVAFARRPGTFALVVDCRSGQIAARLDSPEGRHFYGHGAFSADGALLFTPENDYEAGQGVIGVWDVASGYSRVDEVPSGGVGPHDILRLPDGSFVVANGGIETHPDAGRAKLNLPVMRPNLTYMSAAGSIRSQMELPEEMHLNSIRHLALSDDGLVAFAMQWQGDEYEAPALLGLHREGQEPLLAMAEGPMHDAMQGYAGSVAMDAAGTRAAISSPRGGLVQIFDTATGALVEQVAEADACGLSCGAGGFVITSGIGHVIGYDTGSGRSDWQAASEMQWDNHLVRIG
ncbi:DUF1513 domain-containing protein [Pseudooceanicola nanhaiensis]|uniref:DUF1513 domain-containing protein n=1 Tax=Pseudooceanicola nanhaiensis TaxID=375761 RepID=UPI001CD342BA|nr:DUF1513 domain-containing protein [Pseudooceanicola nanhaiensis]MCA0922304.1 DUF1513 domain-containing protein [Pseudooceanicola nanhaiensis]